MKMLKQFIQIFLLLLPLFFIHVALADKLESSIQEIGKEIGAQIKERQAKKLAVFSFSDLNGYQSALGDFIAEELITALFSEGDFDVVERRELSRIMSEHERYTQGIFDKETVAELQKLLGIDVLITGTITDLGERIKINSRAISVETGKVFAASSVSVDRDPVVDKLMLQQSSNSLTGGNVEQGIISQPSNVYFKNDILHVLPSGVVISDDRRGVTVTTQFRNISNEPLYLGHNYRGGRRGGTDEFISTELGDQFRLRISGIAQIIRNNSMRDKDNYTAIEPNSHINVVWNAQLVGNISQSIKGSTLTIRAEFFSNTQSGVKEFPVQLSGIKLN